MKRDIAFGIAVVLLLLSCAGCSIIPGQAAARQETPPVNSPIEMQQEFPPDYSRAESIKITIYGGTATGQSFIVKRADDSMMWNREELPISHDSIGTPYLPAINFTFKAPDEYLFDVLMDVMFNDWEYSPGKHTHTDEEGHYNIVIYDDANSEIMLFDLFYQNCVLFNGVFYSISPGSDHVTGPMIDSYPFTTAYFISRGLYQVEIPSNGLMENASPGTSVLSLYVYDGGKTRLSTLSTPYSADILEESDAVYVW